MFAYTRRHGLPLCALMVDIDHFKQINDTYGHAAGDRVLKAVAQRLKKTMRQADLCGRLGGEEFGVMLAGTHLHEALQIAEKLRVAIQAIVLPMNDTMLRVTISVGVAEADAACTDITTLLAQADAAMYQAKTGGRNQVYGGYTRSPRAS
jgi:diguanylate cyclase (GGDEF)-like protein